MNFQENPSLGVFRVMKTIISTATALIIGGFLSSALAYKIAEPDDTEYKSTNGKYTLKINAETGLHRVCEGDKVLWSFKREVWHDEYHVSNDGKHVLWVAWEYVKDKQTKEQAVVVYSAEGTVIEKSYAEASKPRQYQAGDVGPVGDFWRI